MKIEMHQKEWSRTHLSLGVTDNVTVAWHRLGLNAPLNASPTAEVSLDSMLINGLHMVALRIEGAGLYLTEEGLLVALDMPGDPAEVTLSGTRFVKVEL